MRILGIDPGLASTGFGAIQCKNRGFSLLTCGYIKTSGREHTAQRVSRIYADLEQLLRSSRPDLVAVENAFSLVRYPRAGILLGSVLGVVYVSVFHHNIPMVEITPKEIKNALVGYGAASKHQVRTQVKKLLGAGHIRSLHASDALAVAVAAYYRKSPGREL